MSIGLAVTGLSDLAWVRAEVRHLAEAACVPAGDVVLVANELVTNALLYTPGPCRLRGWIPVTGAALRVEVSDPLPLPLVEPPGPKAVGGHGLAIVDQLATRWGIEVHAPEGKVIWFEIDAPTSPVRRPMPSDRTEGHHLSRGQRSELAES